MNLPGPETVRAQGSMSEIAWFQQLRIKIEVTMMLQARWIMSKSSLRVFLAVAFLLIGCAAAVTEVAMVMATQRSAPSHLVQIALEHPNLLKGARLKNDSGKPIASYRIGWANVRPNGIELRRGSLVTVRRGIKPGDTNDIPDQVVPFDESAQSVMFFVAEVTFADGTNWEVDIKDIAPEAGFQFSR